MSEEELFAIGHPPRYSRGQMLRPFLLLLSLPLLSELPTLRAADPGASPAAPLLTNPPLPGTNAPAGSPLPGVAYGPAPSENRYDVFSKMITPMAGVLLGGDQTTVRAMTLRATVGQVAGRLPQAIKGASFTARIQYPGRIRVEAPVMGETLTVCRNGNQVWAMPGSKIQFLLGQFHHKPSPQQKNGAPLQLPFTAQQAVLLPALFQLESSSEVAEVGGASCRVIEGGLMPELAKAVKADDLSTKIWVSSEYTPKRIDVRRSDFAMSFMIEELTYEPGFPASTWQPPQGAKDVYTCDAADLEQLLYVLMNSLQMTAEDKPWLNEAGAATGSQSPLQPQTQPLQPGPFGPAR